MKTKRFFGLAMIAALLFALPACEPKDGGGGDDGPGGGGDGGDPPAKQSVSINGVTASANSETVALETDPVSKGIGAKLSAAVDAPVSVTFAVDNTLIAAYNTANSTSCVALPETNLTFTNKTASVAANQTTSGNLALTFSPAGLDGATTYLVPIKISAATPADKVEVATENIVKYYIVTYDAPLPPYEFPSLDMTVNNVASNFIFTTPISLPTYTIEFKFKSNVALTTQLFRIGNFCSSDESNGNLIRYGEAGNAGFECMQGGKPDNVRVKVYSGSGFQQDTWYLMTLVNDGQTVQWYRDGELSGSPATSSTAGGTLAFQRIEIGESWGSPKGFNGSIAEFRLWNRPLAASEIAANICEVANPTTAEGLVGYWKFNEGTGYIFNDASGHGLNMDWSQTRRANSSDVMQNANCSASVNWLTGNSCDR